MIRALLVFSALALAACGSINPPQQVVCRGPDGSVVRSSRSAYWYMNEHSGTYSADYGVSFTPRAGDQCSIQAVNP